MLHFRHMVYATDLFRLQTMKNTIYHSAYFSSDPLLCRILDMDKKLWPWMFHLKIWKWSSLPSLKITLWLTVQLETVLFFIVTVFHLWLEMYHGVILVSGSWANTNMPLLGSQGAKSLKRTHEIALSRVWMGSTCIISREIIYTMVWIFPETRGVDTGK